MTAETINFTADGNSTVKQFTANQDIDSMTTIYEGDFGGGTLKMLLSHDGITFVDVPDTDKTDDATFNVSINIGTYYRYNLNGSTNPDVNVHNILNSN